MFDAGSCPARNVRSVLAGPREKHIRSLAGRLEARFIRHFVRWELWERHDHYFVSALWHHNALDAAAPRYRHGLGKVMAKTLSYSETVAHKAFRRRRYGASIMAALAYRSLACGASLLVAIFALSACGSGSSRHDAERSGSVAAPAADPVAEPNAIVVRVGGRAITRAMFAHALSAAVKFEGPNAPVPSDFAACIKHLEAAPAPSEQSGSKPTVAELKNKCQQQYQMLKEQALGRLIVQQWVVGGAAEEGVHVSDKELKQELKKAERGQSQAQVAQELATSGQTVADFALQTKVQLLGEGIRHMLARKTEHVTRAQVVAYYNKHKRLFGVPQRRDLEIARAGSEAEAQKVKSEIASGKTFASVVSKLPLHQPIFSREGLVSGYKPGLYRQSPLDHAIFAAKPNVLSGPVRISLGYYVFEVKRILPAVQKRIAQVQAAIKQQLPGTLYKQALVAFVKTWRMRWTARTDCRAGYVVPKCRQFKASSATRLGKGDLYSLN